MKAKMILTKEHFNIITSIGNSLTNNLIICLVVLLNSFACCKSVDIRCGKPTYDPISKLKVYTGVDELPKPPHELSLKAYIIKHYDVSPNIGMQIAFRIRFVVDKNGHVVGLGLIPSKNEVSYSVEYLSELNRMKEILRSYNEEWKPGMHCGKKVNTIMYMGLSFVVDENGKLR